MAISVLPIILVGGALFLGGRRKRRGVRSGPPPKEIPQGYFDGDNPPDVIEAKVGEVFSVSFRLIGGVEPHEWLLSASPPDNSIKFIETKEEVLQNQDLEMVGGAYAKINFIFKAESPGKGSIVFHNSPISPPGSGEARPPFEIVEIKTIVS